jgi:hypothetical protein
MTLYAALLPRSKPKGVRDRHEGMNDDQEVPSAPILRIKDT